ncbi:C39 family peptidase [Ectothiorhodospira haloalkaliphila]|uniref:C39 family peptidase n=1 Tax=Ectothiorhodospira haloalkaliphila TaxID=421628 RepID=UPI001EE90C91|nr:C39 family peptidase [Ectothiorhodospira haloalkaliphila]MCG5526043.1 C39 family peptidase [Ectothiorhodospira haloalkaliphila]
MIHVIRGILLLGYLGALLISPVGVASAAGVVIADRFLDEMPVRSWKEIRDEGLVKQRFDYSCGAASLATLLGYHGVETSELEVIDRIGIKAEFSFADLARVAEEFGFRAIGISIDYAALKQLRRPVIVYLNPWDEGHFSVLKGIDAHGVLLADPSWGNARLRRSRFERFWLSQNGASSQGRLLALVPTDEARATGDPLLNLSEDGLLLSPHQLMPLSVQ